MKDGDELFNLYHLILANGWTISRVEINNEIYHVYLNRYSDGDEDGVPCIIKPKDALFLDCGCQQCVWRSEYKKEIRKCQSG